MRAAAVLAAVAWIPSIACGFPVEDVVTEHNTLHIWSSVSNIDTAELPPMVASLTTTVGAWYQPQGSLLGSLNQQLFSGINPQNAPQLMPVTQGLGCDSFTPMTTQIAPALMQTYNAAISQTQVLTNELQGEDFGTLAGNVQAPAVLAATQANGQVLLQIVKELQLLRAQEAVSTMVMATDKLHQLDVAVRAMMPRQGC